jgi:hypothetical protein
VITPDIPVRRFANACWWLLRALTHDGIVEALVDSARELTGADAAFFAGRDGDDLRITAASGLSNPDRLRKIEQILDIDLGDADTRFMLEFALRVHETVRPAGAA